MPKGVRDAGLAAIRGELPITSTSTIPSSTVREDDTAAAPSSDEEVGAGGWVRKKKKTKAASDPLLSSLGTFRANIKKHSQFQVLVFPGTASLPPAERATRKVVSSVDVQR